MKALAAIAVLLLVAACQTPPAEMTEAEIAQIEAEVLETVGILMEGWEAMDADRGLEVFHTEASWSGSSIPRHPPEMRERWNANWETAESIELDFTPTVIRVLTRDAAVVQGTYESTVVRTDGRTWHWPNNVTLNLLLERTEGEWKITVGGQTAGSAEVTGPETG